MKALQDHLEVGLVVSDINMPVMDGLTLLGKLPSLERPVKVVVVSAYGDIENIRAAMNRGAFDFVTKPINFQDLSVTIEKARTDLERVREGQKAQRRLSELETELTLASRIQRSMLPQIFPAFPGRADFEIHATMIPARSVGGDFYDFFLVDPNHLAVVIGDVSGKGVPAALFMASARTLLRAVTMQDVAPGECVTTVNEILVRESDPAMFLTLFLGVLDLRTGMLEFACGGHNPPVAFGPNTEAAFLDLNPDLIVGAFGRVQFNTHRVLIPPNHGLLLYTDGITEAENHSKEEFSEQRLIDIVNPIRDQSAATLSAEVITRVGQHAGGADQSDDMTVVAIRYYGQ
jgi:sigma-B regulation protein RsbU (phosphoserine phosphatase)